MASATLEKHYWHLSLSEEELTHLKEILASVTDDLPLELNEHQILGQAALRQLGLYEASEDIVLSQAQMSGLTACLDFYLNNLDEEPEGLDEELYALIDAGLGKVKEN